MAVTISSNVDADTAKKLRVVAARENRSVSNVVASAVTVFTGLPKGVRDALLELHSQHDEAGIRRLSREMMAALARVQIETATRDLASERIFSGHDDASTEMDMLEEATQLADEAARRK